MKRVLLTGATGLIGKYAIKPLQDLGFEVFAVSSSPKSSQNGINWVKADLLNFEDLKKVFEEVRPEYLLHLAWDTTPGIYLESQSNFNWVESSFEMLKQFKKHCGKRAVFAGTCFEYEFQDKPLTEYGELNPTSTYAKCKNDLNQMATAYCQENAINFGWGRIFYVYGENENEKRLVPHVINNLKNDKEVLITAGELVKDYMFAGDIAEAFVEFLNTNVKGCVNICTGQPVKIKDIVLLIAQQLGKEHLVKFESKEGTEPKIILGDNARLTREIKFTPKYSLQIGLNKIIKGL